MKAMLAIILAASLTFGPPAVNTKPEITTGAVVTEGILPDPLITSYYASQDSAAYEKIQKGAFKRFLSHWANAAAEVDFNKPSWNYESFTRYHLWNSDLVSIGNPDLYYCTFSDENERHGYIVVRYDDRCGGGLQNMGTTETAYPYDLQANWEQISEKLKETGLSLESTTALRGRLDSEEVILFQDDKGRCCVWRLAGEGIEIEQIK